MLYEVITKTGAVPAEPTPLAEVHAPVASAALRGARLEAAQEVVAQQETQDEKGGEIDEGKEKRNVQGRKGTQKPEDGQKPEGRNNFV